MKSNIKISPAFVAFLQALGLFIYCILIGVLFYRGEDWFGPMTHFLGPIFFLLLFVGSALICAFLSLAYPIYLFWEKKQRTKALTIAGYTAAWLLVFMIIIVLVLTCC